ncbi:MAG TPA: Ig-like domain-containing protein, partial [Burkholderiaceae bacterium]
PYTLSWANVPVGSYSITARATDNLGATATSSAASISVSAAANQSPTVGLSSPSNGSTYLSPATIVVSANASDPDGSIAKVEFFNGGTKIGESSSAPYSLSWTNVAAGSYSITARATDNQGATATSTAVSITVNAPANQAPTVSLSSPSNGSTYLSPATIVVSANASDPDGSIAKVEFFNGGTKIGESSTAPYTMNWAGVAAGSYSITARATDNQGATTTSTAVSVTVNAASGTSVNVALRSNGGVASASSTYSSIAYPVTAINDGVLQGTAWGNGGGWNDATSASYPDWAQTTFSGVQSISRIDVYTLADNFATAPAPTSTTTFTQYGITDFQVQYWDGANWVTVPNGNITGNNLVWRSVSFPAVSTDRIRILVSNSLSAFSRIVELQAWSN